MQEVGNNDITILHCVLSYPTDPANANLRIIETLKKDFPNVGVGFSDHVAPDDTMMTLATAYMLGAEIIEKHLHWTKHYWVMIIIMRVIQKILRRQLLILNGLIQFWVLLKRQCLSVKKFLDEKLDVLWYSQEI